MPDIRAQASGVTKTMKKANYSKHYEILTEKIDKREAVVGIIGLGYVGLPLALRFSEEFRSVIGFDIDKEKTEKINSGISYIKQINGDRISEAVSRGLQATNDFTNISQCNIILICVPTPLTKHREPDLSFVRITTETILPFLKEGQALILESTTFPGTTEELIAPRINNKGFSLGDDFFLIYSPEREDPGRENFSTKSIPKIVSGFSPTCKNVAISIYQTIIDKVVPVSDLKTAEMTKLLENIHRAVNIGLVNELKTVTDKMGIDIYEVIEAAATKPFGFTPYYPGPGLGGHCIPIDPFYLTWKAREYGVNTRFIELAGEINAFMPHWVATKIINALNKKGIAIARSKILLLGIAYKKNVDDVRESPSITIMEILNEMGATIRYSDPYVQSFPKMRDHNFNLHSVELNPASLRAFDAVVFCTDHDEFDLHMIGEHSKIIIDTRGKFPTDNPAVVRA